MRLRRATLGWFMPPPRLAPESLAALREKYREIKRLRDEHASGLARDPKARMKALALRFPGALRELDELPMEMVELRLATLDSLVAGAEATPDWVRLQIDYHGLMRAALRIKRMARLERGDRAGAILSQLASGCVDAGDPPHPVRFDRAEIEAVLKPEGGRLNPWVYARVAALHGVDAESVRRALFLR
jgi:hypothetical protein